MPLIIGFVTGSATILETIKDKQTALLPNEVRRDSFAYLGGIEASVTAFDTRRSQSVGDVLDWLGWEDASGVVLLTDDSLPGLNAMLGDYFNVHRFTPPAYNTPTANQLSQILARCLRAYRYMSLRFADAKFQQILRLPLRNFDSPEIAQLQTICRDMLQVNYGREVEKLIGRLRKRQAPKKATKYEDLYYVDDSAKHFQLGHEVHAQAGTAIPPHDRLCIIANQIRFGHRFNGKTHFNVSRDGDQSMVGDYPNCHGVDAPNTRHSHINMFSNDYFT